jgi:hypothetical protein
MSAGAPYRGVAPHMRVREGQEMEVVERRRGKRWEKES